MFFVCVKLCNNAMQVSYINKEIGNIHIRYTFGVWNEQFRSFRMYRGWMIILMTTIMICFINLVDTIIIVTRMLVI